MELFKSSNPALSEKFFSTNMDATFQGTMTVKGTLLKFGFLLLLLIGAASYTWNLIAQDAASTAKTFLFVGLFGGLVCALICVFKPSLARYVSPAYAILEGLFLGALSAMVNAMFAKTYPGIVPQAVGLTFAVAISMFLLYNFRIIRATQKFKAVVVAATVGIGIFYLVTMLLNMFHVSTPFMYNSSLLSIGISLFVVAIAALNLILDFDIIEKGVMSGAPKHMEWYGAFGLMVTIVWLYIEILKLLMKLAGRKQ